MNLEIPVIGILRGIQAEFFGPLMEAAFRGGLQAIEVTYNTPHAEKIVAGHISSIPHGKLLGMGTIRNLDEARKAVDAGAMFLVTPNTDGDVIDFAASCDIPVVAGAFTPTEVYSAWSRGADMIKVFPCSAVGPAYIRELLGPYDDIPLAAVGGISSENAGEYLKAGARAVGVGKCLFGRHAIDIEQPEEIEANVRNFITRIQALKTHSNSLQE